MKKIFLFSICFLFVANIFAQGPYDKVITVTIKDFSEACGEDPGDAVFCLLDEKGNAITERYSCFLDANLWIVEPKDLITENWVINPIYKGKKAMLYCVKHPGGAGWMVQKVEFNLDKLSEAKKAVIPVIEVMTLISGASSEDGATIEFKDKDGVSWYSGLLPQGVVEWEQTEWSAEIKPNFLNKKYTITYELKKVFNEPANVWDTRIEISHMELVK